jgi:hypothetical protein
MQCDNKQRLICAVAEDYGLRSWTVRNRNVFPPLYCIPVTRGVAHIQYPVIEVVGNRRADLCQ